MKLNFKDFIRKYQFPVMMAAGSMPLPMLVCAQAVPDKLGACLLLAAVYVVMAWLCTVLPGKVRIPAGVVLSAGIAVLSFALLPLLAEISTFLIPLLYIVMLLGGLRMGGWSANHELSPMVGSVCLVAHMLAQFLVNVDRQNRAEPMYAAVAPVLTISFLIYGALWLLALNRASLDSADNGRGRIPKSMRIKNRLLTAAMMAVVLLIAAVPAVIRAIERAWEWIKIVLLKLLELIMKIFPEQSGSGGGGGGMDLSGLVGEIHEQSLLSKILEKVVLVLAILIIAVMVVVGLRIIWKKLKVLMAKLLARLNEYMATSSEDYVDEITDTREDGQNERTRRNPLRRILKKRVDESTLSPRERVRYRYLQMWLKHPEWTPERTARENLNAEAADLYERARYSSHDVTEREAETFAQHTDRRRG